MPTIDRSQRAVRRPESFDEVADLYAAARPAYPKALVDDLLALAALRSGCRGLEIGAGTGQLTVPLAERGVRLIAVERGRNLARLLERRLVQFAHVSAVVADFDEWDAPVDPFDVVVAATAFHWLNPSTRVSKCAGLLRPGGTLAIVHTHWGCGEPHDRFTREGQRCYARWDPTFDPGFRPPGPEDLPDRNEELEASGFFDEVVHRRYVCRHTYDARAYCNLLGTFSNILAFDQRRRERFLSCIFKLIDGQFGGRIVRADVYDLWLARTPVCSEVSPGSMRRPTT